MVEFRITEDDDVRAHFLSARRPRWRKLMIAASLLLMFAVALVYPRDMALPVCATLVVCTLITLVSRYLVAPPIVRANYRKHKGVQVGIRVDSSRTAFAWRRTTRHRS